MPSNIEKLWILRIKFPIKSEPKALARMETHISSHTKKNDLNSALLLLLGLSFL